MVDELKFNNYDSPYLAYKQDPAAYVQWAEEKKGVERYHFTQVTGTGFDNIRKDGKTVPMKQPK
jgi:hypothetical protein